MLIVIFHIHIHESYSMHHGPSPDFHVCVHAEQCEEDKFQCPNDEYRYCIPLANLCDSYSDCSDRYDEQNCSKSEHISTALSNILI